MKRLFLVAGLFLYVAVPAQAGTVRTSLKVAERYWGAIPACPVQLLNERLDADGVPAWGEADTPGCRMWLNLPRIDKVFAWVPREGKVFTCLVTVHEWGHMLGHQHSEGGVMDPVFRWGSVPACWRAFPARGRVRRRVVRLR